VHPPSFHSVRYGGVLAPHSKWRSLIVPSPPPAAIAPSTDNIARYLRHLGLPTDVPPLAPARGPPFWQSTVLRRRYGQSSDASDA
jgi:hypothetical protein